MDEERYHDKRRGKSREREATHFPRTGLQQKKKKGKLIGEKMKKLLSKS